MNIDDQEMRRRPSETAAVQAERWLARLRAPDCAADDRRHFQAWLAEHPAHWQAYNRTEQIWVAAAKVQDPQLLALADQVLARGDKSTTTSRHRGRVFGWLGAAAAVVVVLVVAVAWVRSSWLVREPGALTYATAIGEIRSFTLPDGSVITLDTDTVLNVRIGQRTRRVGLQHGQAQFKVAHDRQRPFVVKTSVAQVTALGTVFQVRNAGQATEVDLLEGHVRVTAATATGNSTQMQTLAPGERLLARADQPWVRAPVDLAAASGWLSGRLVFDGVPLRQAVESFNRYSQRKLRIDDPAIASIPIDGVFNAGDTESIVLALKYAYSLRVEERDGEVVLLGNTK